MWGFIIVINKVCIEILIDSNNNFKELQKRLHKDNRLSNINMKNTLSKEKIKWKFIRVNNIKVKRQIFIERIWEFEI